MKSKKDTEVFVAKTTIEPMDTVTPTSTDSPKKKSVTWADGGSDGKIRPDCLSFHKAHSPKKMVLDMEIHRLMKEKGFSEIDATAYVGKASTPSGKDIIKEPAYYESRASIERRYAHVKPHQSLETNSNPGNNSSSFFSADNISLGIAVLGVAATIGLTLMKGR